MGSNCWATYDGNRNHDRSVVLDKENFKGKRVYFWFIIVFVFSSLRD
jgi:hypothetical protein